MTAQSIREVILHLCDSTKHSSTQFCMSNEMEKIGIYEFDPTSKPLGRGTFGEVYLGHEIRDHTKLVAIKKTERKKTTPHCSPKTEIRILNSIRNHPNIVCYLHAQAGSCKLWQCLSSPDVYLVTEYCNGGDFSKYIGKKAPLKQADMVGFLKQIMRAMMTLDSLNIIHRDLKPSNILLNISPGGNITLKVADFGLARILEDSATASTQCGTPAYMAPEVLEGRDYSSRADVFSIGVIAYKCLTAKQPYDKDEKFKKLEQFRAFYASIPRPVPELDHRKLNRCPALRGIIAKTLNLDDTDRQTISELNQEIDSL